MNLRARTRHLCLLSALLAAAGAGCSGEGEINIITRGTPAPQAEVSGLVELPGGDLARAASLWQRVAGSLSAPVRALSGAIEAVGAGVEVELVLVSEDDAADGNIPTNLPVLVTALTNGAGQYQLFLPEGTDPDTCRYMVQVGNAAQGTLTRAFVYDNPSGPVDINFRSEAAVRLILSAIASGQAESLCVFDSAEIGDLYAAIVAAPGFVSGDTIALLNDNGTAAAAADASVQAVIATATGNPPPTAPVPTATPTPTSQATPSRTRTGTSGPTATAPPTNTRLATRTPSLTNTPAPPTNTVAPPTNTIPPPPTNTLPPATFTSTPIVAATATQTLTATPSRTSTTVATPTSTVVLPPEINLTTVVGTAGMIVSVPVVLVGTAISGAAEGTAGTAIVAVANDIEYDSNLVDVVRMDDGKPDCEVAPALGGSKQVIVGEPVISGLPAGRQVLRVGLIGDMNAAPIPPGTLYSCRFAIDADAPVGVVTLDNTAEASDENGNAVIVTGRDGVINVSGAAPGLNLGNVLANPGGTASVGATLQRRGQTVSAVATDIAFDSSVLDFALGSGGNPDCVPDDAVGPGTAADKEIVANILPAAAAGVAAGGTATDQILRVGLIARDNAATLPDGAAFRCSFSVNASAPPQSIQLTHSPEGSSPDGMSVGLNGGAGIITISFQ